VVYRATRHSSLRGYDEKPNKRTEETQMSGSRNTLRIVLLVAAAVSLAAAASLLSEKKKIVDVTTQQIEDTISALDPATRAAVIAKLTTDAGGRVKDRLNR
jgi:flagellar basal body-associated protein FliL